jgi:hypothetical protein
MQEYGLPPAEIVGMTLAAPLVFFGLRRMDLVLDVGVSERSWNLPVWLQEFIEGSNWRSAIVLGFGGGLLGFALGRDARVLAGLVLWIVTTVGVMTLSGGASACCETAVPSGKCSSGRSSAEWSAICSAWWAC